MLEVKEVTNYVPGPRPGIASQVWEIRKDGNQVGVLFDRDLVDRFKEDFNTQFVQGAILSEAPFDENAQVRLVKKGRLLHGAMGLVTEAGELMDMLKKHVFYGKEYDEVNVKEEIGDILWYIALICDHLEVSISDIMTKILAKLRARYEGKFSSEKANNRDLEKERAVLES